MGGLNINVVERAGSGEIVVEAHPPPPTYKVPPTLNACVRVCLLACRYGARLATVNVGTQDNIVFQVLYQNEPSLDSQFWKAWQVRGYMTDDV